jgi:tetratricopeptide (TPR) repeat protein
MLGGGVTIGPYPLPRVVFCRPAGVPAGLADIVAKCLAVDPNDRYPDAARLAEDLRRHLADLPLRGVRNRSLGERAGKWCRRHPHAVARAGMITSAAFALVVLASLMAGADLHQRLRRAESLLGLGREQMHRRDYTAAALALEDGLAQIDGSRALPVLRRPARSRELRRDLASQLARARRHQSAEELHDLADRLRLLIGTERAPIDALKVLERRLGRTWESRDRILTELAPGLDPQLAQRLRTDFLDLGILWADLRVRLAKPAALPGARHEALRVLDEAERLFGVSAVLARERQSHAEALGLENVARQAARLGAQCPPRTAWEHYALGRSLLAAGELDAAALEFDRATELDPHDLWAQFARGLCAFRRGRFETALQAFEVCVALSPRTAECYTNRGLAHAALGRAESALRDRDHALRLESIGSYPAS